MFQYFPTPYPTPGTGNYAFDAGATLPLYQVQGRGIIQKKQYNIRQFGMVRNTSTVTLTDYARGSYSAAGQLIGQPLSPPVTASG